MVKRKIIIAKDGTVRFIYDDKLAPLIASGNFTVKRASHVEPYVFNRGNSRGEWTADMSPVGGPVLGPCRTRAEALAAEKDWLERNHVPEVIR